MTVGFSGKYISQRTLPDPSVTRLCDYLGTVVPTESAVGERRTMTGRSPGFKISKTQS